jgi:hypothetical protein
MSIFLEILIAFLAVWLTWWLVRRMLRPRAPAEPAEDPLASVGAPVKRRPKGRAGAVALEEPDDIDPADYSSPRSSDRFPSIVRITPNEIMLR